MAVVGAALATELRDPSPAEFRQSYETVFPQQVWHPTREITREEMWLAQEDFWVRREMLGIVQDAMNSVALFQAQTERIRLIDRRMGARASATYIANHLAEMQEQLAHAVFNVKEFVFVR